MYLESYDLIDGRKRNAENAYNRKSTLVYAKLIRDRIKKNSHINLLFVLLKLKLNSFSCVIS